METTKRPPLPCQAPGTERALTSAPQHPSTAGLHSLYQQACREAVKAMRKENLDLIDCFVVVTRCIERALERRGVVI